MVFKAVIFSLADPAGFWDKRLSFLRKSIGVLSLPKQFFHYFCPVFKDLLDAFPHKEAMGYGSQETKGDHIIDLIVHLGTGGRFHKGVFVMPKFIRAKTLLIHKIMSFLHMRDLRHPLHPDAQDRGKGIGDDLPGIHGFSILFVGSYHKVHVLRCDLLQIIG